MAAPVLHPKPLLAASPQQTPAPEQQIFLPIISTAPPPPLAKLGVDFGPWITRSEIISDFALAQAMGADWTRLETPWWRIEPTPGQRNWTPYDAPMNQAKALGLKVLANLHSPPRWASLEGCGPVTDTAALTSFVTAMVERYGEIVDVWEFMNEPDGKAYLPNYGPVIGCWSPAPDKYVEQLAIFYRLVKTLDSTAQVMFGSLAYDNWQLFDRDFLDHVLAHDGVGATFDLLGLHYYPINLSEFPSIGVKIQEVRAILQKYLLGDKPIWITETAMWSNSGASVELQKDFIVRQQTIGLCSGADNLFWFEVQQPHYDPALHRWLINRQQQPDQGYYTYQHYATRIKGRACIGRYAPTPDNVEAYRFVRRGDPDLFIVWSTITPNTVLLPAGASALVLDHDGANPRTLLAENGFVRLDVDGRPVFVLIDPPSAKRSTTMKITKK
jgi:hypothetical protein